MSSFCFQVGAMVDFLKKTSFTFKVLTWLNSPFEMHVLRFPLEQQFSRSETVTICLTATDTADCTGRKKLDGISFYGMHKITEPPPDTDSRPKE